MGFVERLPLSVRLWPLLPRQGFGFAQPYARFLPAVGLRPMVCP